MTRPYPVDFGLEELAALARALSQELLTHAIPSPRLPLPERRALADRCTALCQAVHIRARESVLLGHALVSALYGWCAPAEEDTAAVMAAIVTLVLCAEPRREQALLTRGTLMAFLARFLVDAQKDCTQDVA
jgi:hypothetical protein